MLKPAALALIDALALAGSIAVSDRNLAAQLADAAHGPALREFRAATRTARMLDAAHVQALREDARRSKAYERAVKSVARAFRKLGIAANREAIAQRKAARQIAATARKAAVAARKLTREVNAAHVQALKDDKAAGKLTPPPATIAPVVPAASASLADNFLAYTPRRSYSNAASLAAAGYSAIAQLLE